MSGRYEQHKIKVDSTGEVTINLNLTIKLDGNNLSITVDDRAGTPETQSKKLMRQSLQQAVEDVDLIVPNFDADGLIDFGKKVEE